MNNLRLFQEAETILAQTSQGVDFFFQLPLFELDLLELEHMATQLSSPVFLSVNVKPVFLELIQLLCYFYHFYKV